MDDWDALSAAAVRPLPVCLWANTLKLGVEDLRQLLVESGVEPQPLSWTDRAFRVADSQGIGRHWWYRVGLAHSQEEVSQLPVHFMDLKPGQRVLDLCAAPGGKTAQIGLALNNSGTVVANDVAIGRLRAIRGNLERLGLMNVTATRFDGSNYPNAAGSFDRILVDAPCSSEGTVRKLRKGFEPPDAREYARLARVQWALMRRAVGLCRAGGRIVYSTCTFAPEENEALVSRVLAEIGDALRLLPARVKGLRAGQPVLAWNGQTFDPRVTDCLRIWPHHNDTGGFFVAVFEKLAGTDYPLPDWQVPDDGADAVIRQFFERFDLERQEELAWRLSRSSSKGLHLVCADHRPPVFPTPEFIGQHALNIKLSPPKPTTAIAGLSAARARRFFIELDSDQLHEYLSRNAQVIPEAQLAACEAGGWVMVRHGGHGVGLGYLNRSDRRLESLFPKARSLDPGGD